MKRQFKTAREINNMTVAAAIKELGISQPTLSAWEGERKSPSIDALERMSDLYGVSTDYLLGRTAKDTQEQTPSELISVEKLYLYNKKPVWTKKYGWMLVDAANKQFITSDSLKISFENVSEIFVSEPLFVSAAIPQGNPLDRDELKQMTEIWVEPISPDNQLREELRGWYRIKQRFVENEYGNRFYMDTYGAKWLGFESNVK